jgi:hypothetical protein
MKESPVLTFPLLLGGMTIFSIEERSYPAEPGVALVGITA